MKGLPLRGFVAVMLVVMELPACSLLPRSPAVTDPRGVYVWPVASCPAVARMPAGQQAFVEDLTTTLLGDLVSGLLGIPASALTAAAEADKAGFTMTGINARYFYTVASDPRGERTQPIVTPPGCYIVALTRPVATDAPWCSDPLFSAGAADSCRNGAARIAALSGREPLPLAADMAQQHLAVPDFYAEISFDPAGYGSVVRPALAALYYPHSLLQRSSAKPRTLSLTISSTSPQKSDPLKSASIALTLVGVRPMPVQGADTLSSVHTGWTSVPGYKPAKGEPAPVAGRPFMPVTMTASLHEVGRPSAFLAAFAKAFASGTDGLAGAVTGD